MSQLKRMFGTVRFSFSVPSSSMVAPRLGKCTGFEAMRHTSPSVSVRVQREDNGAWRGAMVKAPRVQRSLHACAKWGWRPGRARSYRKAHNGRNGLCCKLATPSYLLRFRGQPFADPSLTIRDILMEKRESWREGRKAHTVCVQVLFEYL